MTSMEHHFGFSAKIWRRFDGCRWKVDDPTTPRSYNALVLSCAHYWAAGNPAVAQDLSKSLSFSCHFTCRSFLHFMEMMAKVPLFHSYCRTFSQFMMVFHINSLNILYAGTRRTLRYFVAIVWSPMFLVNLKININWNENYWNKI